MQRASTLDDGMRRPPATSNRSRQGWAASFDGWHRRGPRPGRGLFLKPAFSARISSPSSLQASSMRLEAGDDPAARQGCGADRRAVRAGFDGGARKPHNANGLAHPAQGLECTAEFEAFGVFADGFLCRVKLDRRRPKRSVRLAILPR
jgi:hypothetical protein